MPIAASLPDLKRCCAALAVAFALTLCPAPPVSAAPDAAALRSAAEAGSAAAQYWYAQHLDALPEERATAAEWYRRAAEQGHREAQVRLARMLERGDGPVADPVQARRYYRQAIDAGAGGGPEFNLALMLEEGRGGPRDLEEAAQLYRSAALTGHARAANNLGTLLIKGEGIEPDRQTGESWYRAAARQGLADAFYNLGVLRMGDTPPDIAAAHAWFVLALERNDAHVAPLVRNAMKAIESGMTPELMQRAKELETEFRGTL